MQLHWANSEGRRFLKERKKERQKEKTAARRYFSLERIVSITISLSRRVERRSRYAVRLLVDGWSLLYRCGNFTTDNNNSLPLRGKNIGRREEVARAPLLAPNLAAFSHWDTGEKRIGPVRVIIGSSSLSRSPLPTTATLLLSNRSVG